MRQAKKVSASVHSGLNKKLKIFVHHDDNIVSSESVNKLFE